MAAKVARLGGSCDIEPLLLNSKLGRKRGGTRQLSRTPTHQFTLAQGRAGFEVHHHPEPPCATCPPSLEAVAAAHHGARQGMGLE